MALHQTLEQALDRAKRYMKTPWSIADYSIVDRDHNAVITAFSEDGSSAKISFEDQKYEDFFLVAINNYDNLLDENIKASKHISKLLARIAELEAENFTLKQNEFSLPVNAKINRKQKAMKDLSQGQANE